MKAPTQSPISDTSSLTSYTKPYLWRIERTGHRPSTLFGTIHLNDKRIIALPNSVKTAISECDYFYNEQKISFLPTLLNGLRQYDLFRGNLKKRLPGDLYNRLEYHFQQHGVPIQRFNTYKTWVLYLELPRLWLNPQYTTSTILDQHLTKLAAKQNKRIGGMESMANAFSAIEQFTHDEHCALLRSSLDAFDQYNANARDYIEELIQCYLRGDENALMALAFNWINLDTAIIEKFKQVLILNRNRTMAKQCERQMQRHPDKSHCFTAGFAHMPEIGGIIDILTNKGYTVTRVE